MEGAEKKARVPVMEGIFTTASDGHPRLIGSRCPRCGGEFFPKKIICSNCFCDQEMEEVLLGPTGRIYAFTTVRMPPPLGFEIPYAYGYVDLVEGNIRVPAMFMQNEIEELSIGKHVTLVIDKLRTDKEGNEIIGYKFEILKQVKRGST